MAHAPLVALLALAFVGASAEPARAGDRPLEVLLVNMTPDVLSGEASRRCVKSMEKLITENNSNVAKIGETALRKRISKTAGEPFLGWSADVLKPAKKGPAGVDALILIDCRPDKNTLDVLVNPAAGGVAKIQLQGVALESSAIELVTEALLRRAWSGFSP